MHSNKSTFKGVIERFKLGMCDWETSNNFEALTKVSVPELIASRKCF